MKRRAPRGPLEREAVRLYRRYAVEIVEGLGFCPYAERARLDGKTHEVVLAERAPSDAALLLAIEAVADDESIELGLVLLPRLEVEPRALGRRVERIRKAHAATRGGTPVLAIEGFHPFAEPDLSSPERLTPFVRRTPDPTLQLTRLDALERVRRGTSTGTGFFDPSTGDLASLLSAKRPLHERIGEMNHATVNRLGPDEVARTMNSILADRNETYRSLDESIAPRTAPPLS